jgi:hypothetical protein
MADMSKIMAALGGFGAGYQGQGAQYLEGIQREKLLGQQEQEKEQALDDRRKAAMVQDAWTVNKLLDENKIPIALKLLDNRIENIQKLKGDPSDTMAIKEALVSGDPARVAQAKQELQVFSEAGIAAGAWAPPQEKEKEGFTLGEGQKRFDAQGREIASVSKTFDPRASEAAKQQFGAQVTLKDESGNLFFATTRQDPNTGQVQSAIAPLDGTSKPQGRLSITGQYGLTAPEKVGLAGDQATAETTGKSQAERRDLFKTQGLAAAENLPTLNRALELQKGISTGGFAKNIKGMQNYLGVASADEGELNSLFSQNILGQLKATFGGNPTEGEREALKQAQSSFEQTGKINERLLQNAIKLANERVQRGRRAAEADKDTGTIGEFDSLGKLTLGGDNKTETAAQRLARLTSGK